MRLPRLHFSLFFCAIAGCGGNVYVGESPHDAGQGAGGSAQSATASGTGGSPGTGGAPTTNTGGSAGNEGTADASTTIVHPGNGSDSSSTTVGLSDASTTTQPGTTRDAANGCFADAVPDSYKTCSVDRDCMEKIHMTDCCGNSRSIGINVSTFAEYSRCEQIWRDHFPGCGCAGRDPVADDGKSVASGTQATVHCVASPSGSVCKTSVP
jgi:hypothetical protein